LLYSTKIIHIEKVDSATPANLEICGGGDESPALGARSCVFIGRVRIPKGGRADSAVWRAIEIVATVTMLVTWSPLGLFGAVERCAVVLLAAELASLSRA